MCQGKFMRPILLACMTQAPWRCLSNKSNPYHLLALHSVSSEHGRDPIKSYCSLCQPWAQISCWIIVGCEEPPLRNLLWDPCGFPGWKCRGWLWPSAPRPPSPVLGWQQQQQGLAMGTAVTEVGTEVSSSTSQVLDEDLAALGDAAGPGKTRGVWGPSEDAAEGIL